MDTVDLLLLTSAVWLAPTCRRKFQLFMGAAYVVGAAIVMIARR